MSGITKTNPRRLECRRRVIGGRPAVAGQLWAAGTGYRMSIISTGWTELSSSGAVR